ncbi:SOS response-associated peptidase family protein [Gryllotalpicola protaetiae]|uniref:Abasic site processing protein n=1 Tax=Gryllotalpicola protaetiae TaxID=2419771 RepID=A0A387BMZ4_9MICO|nr:SOS response-associated peptidase family protein [Gryllotalpicola protaetiae]AYG02357.1 hypothetical protein D7I44_01625 [Gryllotalpicola protaetiae]
MCASYGLGGGSHEGDPPPILPALNDKVLLTVDWGAPVAPSPGVLEAFYGKRTLTGRKERKLNGIYRVNGDKLIADTAWFKLWMGGKFPTGNTFNARSDTLATKWRGYFKASRALVPADWFNEKGNDYTTASGEPFMIAAVYNRVHDEFDNPLTSYALVTRDAAGAVADSHDRMPLILPPDLWRTWLDPHEPGTRELAEAAVAASDELSNGIRLLTRPEPQTA